MAPYLFFSTSFFTEGCEAAGVGPADDEEDDEAPRFVEDVPGSVVVELDSSVLLLDAEFVPTDSSGSGSFSNPPQSHFQQAGLVVVASRLAGLLLKNSYFVPWWLVLNFFSLT